MRSANKVLNIDEGRCW